MKVISPSYEILDRLDHQSLPVRIEYCGRICYKSEDKITADSALQFFEKIAKSGHNSVLEMGVLTLEVWCRDYEDRGRFLSLVPKYLHISRLLYGLEITGSVRAFRELLLFHPEDLVVKAISNYLQKRYQWFFIGIDQEIFHYPEDDENITVSKLDLDEIDTFSPGYFAKHRHIAVKFVINRAISHEIVRHRPCSFLQESQRYCNYSQGKFGGEVTFIKPMFFDDDSYEFRIWRRTCLEAETAYLHLLHQGASPQAARTVLPNSCKTELIVYCNLAEWKHIFRLRTSKAAEPSMREVMIPLQEEFKRRWPEVF